MAPFSSLLSNQQKEARLQAGTIIYCNCPATIPPKYKYQLICNKEPLLVLLVNSRINDFIANNPDLLKCQVQLLSEDYDFFQHDSHLNCVDAHDCYNFTDIKEIIVNNYTEVYKGKLLPNTVRDVIRAVNESDVMMPLHKKMITASLNEYLRSI